MCPNAMDVGFSGTTYAKVWNLICTMDVNVGRILLLKSGTYGQ